MFEITPGSPLVGAQVDFRSTRFSEPLDADEQGGWRSEISRLELDGKQIREPGFAVFRPQVWPFSEVLEVQVTDVELDNPRNLKFSRGKMPLQGQARYQVLLEDGVVETQYLPVIGQMTLSPSFEKRLEVMQKPPSEVSPQASSDREEVLQLLLERVGDWGKPLVREALQDLKAGVPLSEDVLRGLRHRLYKSDLREEADMFRTASNAPSAKNVVRIYSRKANLRVAKSSPQWLSWISQPFTTLVRRSSEFVSGPVDDAMDNVIRDVAPALVAALGEREIDEDVEEFQEGANHGRHDALAGLFADQESSWSKDYSSGYDWGFANAKDWRTRDIPPRVKKQVVRENLIEFRGQVTEQVVEEALSKAWHAVDPRETVKAMIHAVRQHGWKVGIGFALFEIFEHSVLPVAMVSLTGRPEAAIVGTLPLGEIIIPIVLRAVGRVPQKLDQAQPDGHLDWYVQNFGSVRLGSRNRRGPL